MPRRNIEVISGHGQLNSSLTTTSAGGAFVVTRFEIDTTLVGAWTTLGQSFAKWRVRSIHFHFTGIKGSTTDGLVGICILDDPNMTSPNTTVTALANRQAVLGKVHEHISLMYRPKHTPWLFTRDTVASTEDRLEMPGDVCYFTSDTSSAFTPGIAWCDFVVEFTELTNSTVAPLGLGIKNGKGDDVDRLIKLQKEVEVAELELKLRMFRILLNLVRMLCMI